MQVRVFTFDLLGLVILSLRFKMAHGVDPDNQELEFVMLDLASSSQTFANNVTTKVAWNQVVAQRGAFVVDLAGDIRVPSTGLYSISYSFAFSSTNDQTQQFSWRQGWVNYKNLRIATYDQPGSPEGFNTWINMTGSAIWPIDDVSQPLSLYMYQTSGSTVGPFIQIHGADNIQHYFTVVKLCDLGTTLVNS